MLSDSSLALAELRSCLRQIPASVCALDRAARIAWCSRYVGGHGPGIVGKPAPEFIHPEDRDAWMQRFYAARDLRERGRLAVRVLCPEEPGTVCMDAEFSPVLIDDAVRFVLVVASECRPGAKAAPALPVLPVRPPHVPSTARWLSPFAERIVALLATSPLKWTPCDAIAQRLGEPPGHRLKIIMANLVDRGIIESSAGSGYRLVIEADA